MLISKTKPAVAIALALFVLGQVVPANADLIGTLDYSDTFTLETTNRPVAYAATIPYSTPASYNIVETACHGMPSLSWSVSASPYGRGFSYELGGPVTTTGLWESDTAFSGSGVAYANYRSDYVVQFDAILGTDWLSIGTNGWAGSNGLQVFVRTGEFALFNASTAETLTDITTGIAAGTERDWHNFAIDFNQGENKLSFYVDRAFRGTVDLTTFASGAYKDFTSNTVDFVSSAQTSTGVGYIDNFQIGAPIPEPSVVTLLATGLFGLLAYAWRKRK